MKQMLKSTESYKVIATAIFLLALVVSCNKETLPPINSTVNNNPPQPPTPFFPGPLPRSAGVGAGENQYILLHDTCLLEGKAYDPENKIRSYSWEKVLGPSSHFIITPDSLKTKITNLEAGDYTFQLTARGLDGLEKWARVKVFVIQPGQNEVVFKELQWSCVMGCSTGINNFYSFVPRNKPFLVFVREANSTVWQPVVKEGEFFDSTDKYLYLKGDNGVGILALQPWGGNIDVKITY